MKLRTLFCPLSFRSKCSSMASALSPPTDIPFSTSPGGGGGGVLS